MKFSLVNVSNDNGEVVDGVWMQNHVGSLESATQRARDTEAVNSSHGGITVAVVDDLGYALPNYSTRMGLKRLDVPKN